jgi:hypothetical protein
MARITGIKTSAKAAESLRSLFTVYPYNYEKY